MVCDRCIRLYDMISQHQYRFQLKPDAHGSMVLTSNMSNEVGVNPRELKSTEPSPDYGRGEQTRRCTLYTDT